MIVITNYYYWYISIFKNQVVIDTKVKKLN